MTNIEKLQRALSERNLEALVLSDIQSVGWATGFTGSFGFLIVTPSSARFITDSRYTIQAKEQLGDIETVSFGAPVLLEQFIAENVAELGLATLGFESNSVSYKTFQDWSKAMPAVELIAVPDLLAPLRMVKTEIEIEATRRACNLADECFSHVRKLVRPGVSEYDLGLEIEFFFRRAGAGLAFEPIVVSGERSARPHGRPSSKLLEGGDFVTMDFGAVLDGYCSDLTRTIVVTEASDRHREVYDLVLKAQMAALDMMRPGVRAKDVDAEARLVMGSYSSYFGHGLGHGLGRVVHDGGRLGTSSTDVLEEGQIWTVEPGIYIPSFGGVRIEDDVVITAEGIEILTNSTKDLLLLPE